MNSNEAADCLKFEYIRHGTTSLIGFFDVVTGRIEMPYLNSTRTEDDFVEAVKALTGTDPQAPWTFICDGLNTHKSEALVRFVAEACAPGVELGKKGKQVSLKVWKAGRISCMTLPTGSALSILRNTVPG